MTEDRVTRYARNVVEGREIAGHDVILACQRHLNDLENSKLAVYKYYFDVDKANDVIAFFENLTYTDGDEIKGQQVALADFQCFIVGSLFGWVDKENGYRKYRKSYVQLARKNTKSLLNSGIALYLASFDGYDNAQVYCTATKMKQARVVWKQCKLFIEADQELSELYKIKDHDAIIEDRETGGYIMALGRDTGTIDGFNPHGGIIDEYHAHKTNQMVKLLEDGAVTQRQSLISIITTAGFDLNSPCHEEYEYCEKVLEGIAEDEHIFIYIAQMDEGDNIHDPSNWVKANPLSATVPFMLENLKKTYKQAFEMGGEDWTDFLTKNLNIWVTFSKNQYINYDFWKKGACKKTLSDFIGSPCYVGLDLSSGGDLTSLVIEIPFYEESEDGKKTKKYFLHSQSFMPAARVIEHRKTDKAPYDRWIEKGLIVVTETNQGIKTDYKYILAYLRELIEKYDLNVIYIGYDPHNAAAFLEDLEEIGDCVEIVQSCRSLNDATVDFKLEIEAGNIYYNQGEKLLSWSAKNAKTVSNSFKEIKIDKDLSTKRIDPIDACIDAHKLAFKAVAETKGPQMFVPNFDK